MIFSYKDQPNTLESEEQYRALLKRGLVEFTMFKNKRKITGTTKKMYDLWWRFYGPLGFRTNDDALRYKHDVWEFIRGLTDESNVVTISPNQ